MKDPSRSSTSPSIISEDVIINGHSHEDDNPFAEYMWMENEEEFNRQASPFPLSVPRASPCCVVAAGSGAVPADWVAGLGILLWWDFRWVC